MSTSSFFSPAHETGFPYRRVGVILLLLTFIQIARAGGPRYIAGISYFNQGTAGTPLTWAQGVVNYYTDQGPLSATVPSGQVKPTSDREIAEVGDAEDIRLPGKSADALTSETA